MEEPSASNREGIASIMTIHDVTRYFRMRDPKVYRMKKEGSVPFCRLRKSFGFRKDLIDDWKLKETLQVCPISGWSSRHA